MSTAFHFDVVTYFEQNGAQIRGDLGEYFSRYTGRWFEHWSEAGDEERFDLHDVAACASLGVSLSGDAVAALLVESAEPLTAALAACPGRDVRIWELDRADVDDGGAFMTLYRALRVLVPDVGYVRATKLLASKRPHAMPIRDTVVEWLLGLRPKQNDWLGWHALMSDADFRRMVERVSADVVPRETSLLRRVDVALWMEGKRRLAGATPAIDPRAA